MESASVGGGRDIVTYEYGEGIRVGCSICDDLLFSELYQALFKKGAHIIMTPATFMLLTGKTHWEVPLRARAVETETYVVAPAQTGRFSTGNTYGHSLVVDPWGHVIAKASDNMGYVTASLDFSYHESVRAEIPLPRKRFCKIIVFLSGQGDER